MGQLGFFDAERRLAALSKKGDPLEAIAALVPWESFRVDIEAAVLTPEEEKKSKAGRKPIDAIVMFRMLVLQALSSLGSGDVHAICRSWVGGWHSRRHDAVAVPREAGAGWTDRNVVRSVRPASQRAGLHRTRRADGGCEHCAGAEATQYARGE